MGSALQVILASIAVVALALLCLRLLRTFMQGSMGGGNLEVVEAISVGRKAQLVLVRIGQKYTVLGVTEAGVVRVTEMDDEVSEVLSGNALESSGGWLSTLKGFSADRD